MASMDSVWAAVRYCPPGSSFALAIAESTAVGLVGLVGAVVMAEASAIVAIVFNMSGSLCEYQRVMRQGWKTWFVAHQTTSKSVGLESPVINKLMPILSDVKDACQRHWLTAVRNK